MKGLFTPIFLSYLRFAAKLQLKKIRPKIVGIAGSSGKSSTSMLTTVVLREKFKVKQTGGKNSETGIPLSILDLDINSYGLFNWFTIVFKSLIAALTNFKKYDIFVAEMGIDSPYEPKNMSYLLKIIKPDIAVLTNISYEHSVYFEKEVKNDENKQKEVLDSIVWEEASLIKSLNENSYAVINLDDSNTASFLKEVKAKIVSVSTKEKSATYFIDKIKTSLYKFEVKFKFENKTYVIKLNLPLPDFYAYSFLFSIAVSGILEVETGEAIKILEDKFSLPPGRLSILKGIKDSIIIDSSYNNSLEPAVGIMEMVAKIAGGRRRIGILGDMREQGSQSAMLHQQLAEKMIENLDFAILIGPMLSTYAPPILQEKGFSFLAFKNFSEAKEHILESIQTKDIIMVKGSQNELFLERAVELLLANSIDVEKLCRRGAFWDKVRGKTP